MNQEIIDFRDILSLCDNFTSTVKVLLFPVVHFVTQLRDLRLVFFQLRRVHVHLSGQRLCTRHTPAIADRQYC